MATPRERLNQLRALERGVGAATQTPRERLEQLRALDAQPQPGMVDQPGLGESMARGFTQGATFGFADEIGGAVRTGVQRVFSDVPEQSRPFAENLETERALRDAAAERNPTGFGVGAIGGGIATGTAVGAPMVAGSSTIGQAVVRGGTQGLIQGGLAGAGFADENKLEEALEGAATGGTLGAAIPGMFAATQTAVRAVQSAPYTRALRTLEQAGVKSITTGQALGSNQLKALESDLARLPLAGVASRIKRARTQYQRAVLREAGLPNSNGLINEDTLRKARIRVRAQYKNALRGKKVDLSDQKFLDDLDAVENEFTQLRDFEQKGKVRSVIESLRDDANKATGLTGEEYQRLRSKIGDLAWKTRNTNEDLSDMYASLRNALDDQFQRSAPTPELVDINKRYANLSTLEDIWSGRGGSEVIEGFLPPSALARQASKGRNSNEFKQLARAGATVLPDRAPNSGTAARTAVLALVGAGGFGAGSVASGNLSVEDAAKIGLFGLAGALGARGLTSGSVARDVVLRGAQGSTAAGITGATTGAVVTGTN